MSSKRQERVEEFWFEQRDGRVDDVQVQVVTSLKHEVVRMRVWQFSAVANCVLMAGALARVDYRQVRRRGDAVAFSSDEYTIVDLMHASFTLSA